MLILPDRSGEKPPNATVIMTGATWGAATVKSQPDDVKPGSCQQCTQPKHGVANQATRLPVATV